MKKIILSSLVILGLVGAIAGATIAYFSSTKTSVGNTFAAGTMEFRIARPGGDHRIFSVSNLKPGQVVSGYFVVVNDSTAGLDMKWKAWVSGFGSGYLDDVLEVRITGRPDGYPEYITFTTAGYTIAGPVNAPVTHWSDGTPKWVAIQDLDAGNSILAWNYGCCIQGSCPPGPIGQNEPFRVGWAGVYKIEVRMLETAGNNYQNTSFTGDINFYATQCEATL